MSEAEIQDVLEDQGVVGVNRVTLKKEGKVIPTNTLFLTFGSLELPEETMVAWLSKDEGGLVCSQPYALLQLQQVWTHKPTLQGCCKVYRL